MDFRQVYDSVLAVRTAEEKAQQIEQTRKEIETLKAESEQQGEALFEVEPGKAKKEKKNKKSKKKEAEAPAEEVKDESANEQEQAQVNITRKEDDNEA